MSQVMSDLNLLYTGILTSLGYQVQDDGKVLAPVDGDSFKILTVQGKTLCIPKQDILEVADWDNTMVFHPLCENAIRKESVIHLRLRRWINSRLHWKIRMLLSHLMCLNADVSLHKEFSPSQREMLKHMAKVGNITVKHQKKLETVLNKTSPDSDSRLVSIFIKRNARIGNQDCRRAAMVDFPFMHEPTGEKPSIYGVVMTPPEYRILTGLFDYVFPMCDSTNNAYTSASMDMNAPGFDALMKAYIKITERLNEVFRLFYDLIPEGAEMISDLDWVEFLTPENIQRFRAAVPATPGNEGELIMDKPVVGAVTNQPTQHVPQKSATALATSAPAKGISWTEAKAKMAANMGVPATNFHQAPPQVGGVAPVQQNVNGGYYPPVPAPAPAPMYQPQAPMYQPQPQPQQQYAPQQYAQPAYAPQQQYAQPMPQLPPIQTMRVVGELNGMVNLVGPNNERVDMPVWEYNQLMGVGQQPVAAPMYLPQQQYQQPVGQIPPGSSPRRQREMHQAAARAAIGGYPYGAQPVPQQQYAQPAVNTGYYPQHPALGYHR